MGQNLVTHYSHHGEICYYPVLCVRTDFWPKNGLYKGLEGIKAVNLPGHAPKYPIFIKICPPRANPAEREECASYSPEKHYFTIFLTNGLLKGFIRFIHAPGRKNRK